jgi:hypothetical protein
MGDRRKRQTYTASPAEPGGLPVMLESGVAGSPRFCINDLLTVYFLTATSARHISPRARGGVACPCLPGG